MHRELVHKRMYVNLCWACGFVCKSCAPKSRQQLLVFFLLRLGHVELGWLRVGVAGTERTDSTFAFLVKMKLAIVEQQLNVRRPLTNAAVTHIRL